MIRFRIISFRAGVILVFLLLISDNCDSSLDPTELAIWPATFEPDPEPPSLFRYPLSQRILGARTCHMQLVLLFVKRVIDSWLKVVNLDSNHHQVLCEFWLPPILSSNYSSMISEFDVRWAQHSSLLWHVPSGTYDSISWDYYDCLDYQRTCNFFYSEIWDCHTRTYALLFVVKASKAFLNFFN